MVATVRRAWRRAMSISQHWMTWARNTAVKIILLIALLTFQMWLAFFMYGTFYYAYMPTELHTKPVYLDFSLCDRFDGSESCPFPRSNFSLVKDASQDRLFMPGQKYHISLEMEMPQSPVNEQSGMFMVKIQMFSKADEPVVFSSRPAMLRYRSPILKVIDIFCLAPFFIAGYAEEKQVLNVDLMTDYVDNVYKPAIKASLEVKVKQLEIYHSTLQIHAQFTGLRYLMFYWPMTSAFFSVVTNFVFLSFLSIMMWRQCVGAFIEEPELEAELETRSPVLSYEERRRLTRQSMGQERSALFRNRPPHVTIIDPHDNDLQHTQASSPPSRAPGTSQQHYASHSQSPHRIVRRHASRSQEDRTVVMEQTSPEGQSSGVSSDNSDSNQDRSLKVETLKGEGSLSESLQSSTSEESEEPVTKLEKPDEKLEVRIGDPDHEKEDQGRNVTASTREAESECGEHSSCASGLRHRSGLSK
ncbi:seipin-like [Diadema setosum]|uniref:seipin-like n=1 Tax=Diadema setosum TaxID=31175 RepID=UPI003B3B1A99